MSWFINLLTGLIALLISAAMLHFGGASEAAPQKPTQPVSAPDNPRSSDTGENSR